VCTRKKFLKTLILFKAMRKIFTTLAFLCSLHAWSLDPNHFTITRVTAPYFIVDGNSPATITKAYVGFEVTNNSNSGITYSALRFLITSISTSVAGQNYSVVAPVSGVVNVGTLAPGQSKVCYYYVSYPANVTPQATFNIQLSDNTASSKTQSFIIRNRSSISANAGGTATQTFSNQDLIGGLIIDDVTYVVGNVQSGDENDFQVAVSTQFDPTKISLLSTQVIASSVPGINIGTTDSLYFITGNGSNGATITMRWTFRITGYNFTNYLLPCAGATSGSTNYKYALNTNLGSGTPVIVSAAANPLTIAKTSNKILYGTNSPSVFTITIQNPGAYGVTIDKITDQLPAGFVFQSFDAASQVTAANSTMVPASGATGTISFEGGVVAGPNTSYYVAAGGSLIIKYNATSSSSTASNLVTNVIDYIGATQVGTAQNTVSVSATLPVTLVSFKAKRITEGVKLEWITSGETNSSHFELERNNGSDPFVTIGRENAAGVTTGISSYSFIDSFPLSGTSYYRIKMIDHDQRFKYSPVVAVVHSLKGIEIGGIYPNPFTEQLTFTVSLQKQEALLLGFYDLSGHTIMQKAINGKKGSNAITLDHLGSLKPGVYVLQLTAASGSFREKIMKIK
jgi:uncharacterized repeat protein (TIGR01451 family)